MSLEVERKYLGACEEDLLPALAALGATRVLAPHFESNTVFDNREGTLFAGHRLLRLRCREWADHADGVLTCKIPLADLELATGPVKRREELEIPLTSREHISTLARILGELGYTPAGRYEKVRSSWAVTLKGATAHIDMDTLPFVQAVEIEAQPAAIELLEARLGLDKFPLSAKSYHVLYLEWLAAHNRPADTHMVFAPDRRILLRARLHLDA